tara:strand:+ start:59 stop:517 length:459 start_codon:yes stop_codon:yes gene_type:complete
MKRLLLLTAIFLSGCIDVDIELESDGPAINPTETISLYVDNFNNADIKLLNETTESPFFWLRGVETDVYESYGDSVDFDGLRRSGWSYSKVNSLELIYEDSETSMVNMNFSRYDEDDRVILTSSANYLLMNDDGVWKIKGGFAPSKISIGKD